MTETVATKPTLVSVVFGASPWTSIIGFVAAIATASDELIKAGGLPHDVGGWQQLAIAVGLAVFGRFTKQSNVTNAATPVAARAVPEVAPLPPPPPPPVP